MSPPANAALLLGSLLLAGCGFHLRQAPDLPPQMQKIYIAAPGGNGYLMRELRRGLASEDTEVLESPAGATAILSIISVSRRSLPLAIDRKGEALEYQVSNRVEFALSVDGATVIQPQAVVLTRNYAYSVSNQVANEEQEDTLNKVLAKDISQFIIFRVVAAAKSLAPVYSFPGAVIGAVPAAAVPAPAPSTQPAPAAASAPPPV
jgi:LPS-assembly lipoprotein